MGLCQRRPRAFSTRASCFGNDFAGAGSLPMLEETLRLVRATPAVFHAPRGSHTQTRGPRNRGQPPPHLRPQPAAGSVFSSQAQGVWGERSCQWRPARNPLALGWLCLGFGGDHTHMREASLQSESQTPTRGPTNAARKQAQKEKQKDRGEEKRESRKAGGERGKRRVCGTPRWGSQ